MEFSDAVTRLVEAVEAGDGQALDEILVNHHILCGLAARTLSSTEMADVVWARLSEKSHGRVDMLIYPVLMQLATNTKSEKYCTLLMESAQAPSLGYDSSLWKVLAAVENPSEEYLRTVYAFARSFYGCLNGFEEAFGPVFQSQSSEFLNSLV